MQAKEHIPNLLLLTEDVNLRNKAICNNILVSTKSDLVAKRYDSSATDDDKSWRKKTSFWSNKINNFLQSFKLK